MSIEAIIRTDKPSGDSMTHSHASSWELILATEGEGAVVALGHAVMPFKVGSIAVIPPGVEHYNTSDAPYKQMALKLSTQAPLADGPFTIEDDDGSFLSMMTVIFNAFYKQTAHSTTLLGSLEDGILALIAISTEREGKKNPEVEKLLGIINSSFTDPEFHIGRAVTAVAYSEAHLRKLFQNDVGMTMSRYLNHLRLEHAKRILKSDDCSILTAAELSGFADFRYFSRLFKLTYGTTPSEWRIKNRM